jgi:hypothetical protein
VSCYIFINNQTIKYGKQNKVKVNSHCYLTHLINNKTIKYTKQNHNNCAECPWYSMQFTTCNSSDQVASVMVSGWFCMCSAAAKTQWSSAGLVWAFVSYTKPPSSQGPNDGGNMHLWNASKLLPDYAAQHPRRQSSSSSFLSIS